MAKPAEKPRVRPRPSAEPLQNSPKTPDPAIPPLNPPPAAVSEDDVQRLTVPVDPKTGFIAWDRLRSPERTTNTLKRIFEDSRLAPAAAATPEDSAALNAVVVNVLYDAIGMIAVVTARSRGYSEDAATLLRFSETEKQTLAPQTVKVLNKYNLLGGKYADEITLLVAVAGITGAHVLAMQQQFDAKARTAAVLAPMQPEPTDILGERTAS